MTILTDFRAAVVEQVTTVLPDLPLHPIVPDNVAELPCAVVSLPSFDPGPNEAVADLTLELFLIGRRIEVGDTEPELLDWTDQLIDALGGTRRVVSSNGVQIHLIDSSPRVVDIGGMQYLSMVSTVTASAVTC